MPQQYETGHAKNVANFEELIAHCTAFGAAYNPSQNAIKITQLNTLLTSAQNALSSVSDKFAKLYTAQNLRQTLFETLIALTKRIIYALDASGPTQKAVADARSLAKQIYGSRRKKKQPDITVPPPAPQTPQAEAAQSKQISSSHKSFVNRLQNFKKIIELLEEEPLYTPNEADLKIASLQTFASQVSSKNTDIATFSTDLDNARTTRNHILYDKNTGLVDIAWEAKKYVKSVFGPTSPEYKEISHIEFTRPR